MEISPLNKVETVVFPANVFNQVKEEAVLLAFKEAQTIQVLDGSFASLSTLHLESMSLFSEKEERERENKKMKIGRLED